MDISNVLLLTFQRLHNLLIVPSLKEALVFEVDLNSNCIHPQENYPYTLP